LILVANFAGRGVVAAHSKTSRADAVTSIVERFVATRRAGLHRKRATLSGLRLSSRETELREDALRLSSAWREIA